MADRMQDAGDMNDEKLEELFSTLDSVRAPEDLKSSTLNAIFSAAKDNGGTSGKAAGHSPKLKAVGGKRGKSNSRTIRIAGIAACLAVFGVGAGLYALPTTQASIDDGETTFTLGINQLGMTVSAEADSPEGEQIIAEHDPSGKNYRDAVGTVVSAVADQSGKPKTGISLSVSSDSASQRDAVRKGSSEAIEISGYKKQAPLAEGSDAETDAPSAAHQAAENAKNSGAARKGSEKTGSGKPGAAAAAAAANEAVEDEESVSFEIDADRADGASAFRANDSDPAISKYHPLSGDDEADGSEGEDATSEKRLPSEETTLETASN